MTFQSREVLQHVFSSSSEPMCFLFEWTWSRASLRTLYCPLERTVSWVIQTPCPLWTTSVKTWMINATETTWTTFRTNPETSADQTLHLSPTWTNSSSPRGHWGSNSTISTLTRTFERDVNSFTVSRRNLRSWISCCCSADPHTCGPPAVRAPLLSNMADVVWPPPHRLTAPCWTGGTATPRIPDV